MGINSTEVSYGFGQMGSAYTDLAQTIVPPQDMVIVAIQFLAEGTPTVLTPELLGRTTAVGGGVGPGFPEITSGTNVTGINSTCTRNSTGMFMAALDDNSGSDITQVTLSSFETRRPGVITPGMYVLLVNADYQEDGNPAMVIDAQTPTPIYGGPNQRGVKVLSVDSDDQITLSAGISPSSQALIFLGPQQGAGGIIANGQAYPAGTTIYGRWTEFKNSAAGVICYFGK
tara:strand:+ start:1634 stop:2320 length:687 start_codon:yes stop_codon:yes gene_type:complete